jgi:hypothetical protein
MYRSRACRYADVANSSFALGSALLELLTVRHRAVRYSTVLSRTVTAQWLHTHAAARRRGCYGGRSGGGAWWARAASGRGARPSGASSAARRRQHGTAPSLRVCRRAGVDVPGVARDGLCLRPEGDSSRTRTSHAHAPLVCLAALGSAGLRRKRTSHAACQVHARRGAAQRMWHSVQHARCNMHQSACDLQHARCNIHRPACNGQSNQIIHRTGDS